MTAYLYWDRVWKETGGSDGWDQPDQWVVSAASMARKAGASRALDLGCGVGRHALHLARTGFRTSATDRSPHALATARENAAADGLDVDFRTGDMTRLPYADNEFDYVLAYNVVYHGDETKLSRTLDEIRRVLRPGGLYQATMLSKRNAEYGRGIEVSPNTFQQPQATDDKVHDHLYCDFRDIARLHAGFEPVSLADHEHTAPGSFHWHCLFEFRDTGNQV